MYHDRLNLPVRGSNLHGNRLCGNSSIFLDRVCLTPRSLCFGREEVTFVLFVVVFVLFVLFAFTLAVVVVLEFLLFDCVPVVSLLVFFFSAAAVFDFGDDDLLTVRDAPVERVTFFPVERGEDFFGDCEEVVVLVISVNNSVEVHHLI